MYSVITESGKVKYGIKKIICDTETDKAILSVNLTPGSLAFVIESGKTYMLNHNKQWVEIPGGGGSGGDGVYWDDYGTGV